MLEILDALLSRSSTERLHLSTYAAPSEALAKYASSNGFDIQRLARAKLLGKLGRADLAQQLRGCDVCMDLLAWQTFARSGLESMARGCVPMLPNCGKSVQPES